MVDFEDEDHPLVRLYEQRVEQNRDLTILISDRNNERGSGKTVLSLKLADAMDRTDAGLTFDKCSIDPRPMAKAYVDEPEGSALVLDESEAGLSKYRAGSGVNEAVRKLVQMGRVEEKYLIMNAPGSHMVDGDLRSLVDVWIIVQRRGFAHAYRMGYNPFGNHPLTQKIGNIRWTDIPKRSPLRTVYNQLTEEKRARLRNEDGEGDSYVEAGEMREAVERTRKTAERQTRDEILRTLYQNTPGITQQQLADSVGLSRSRVADILTEA